MIPILVEGPAVEPVSLPEMRAWLRLDDTAEDDLVAVLVRAARLLVESAAGRLLISQTWRLTLARWPAGRIVILPLSPLLSVERVRVIDAAGAGADLDPSLYAAEPSADPPRLVVGDAAPEPGRGIEIEVRAGYGTAADAVPEPLRQAIRLLAARWFENRGDGPGEASLPPDLQPLVAPYRRARL